MLQYPMPSFTPSTRIFVTPETAKLLNATAEAADVSASEIVRVAIRKQVLTAGGRPKNKPGAGRTYKIQVHMDPQLKALVRENAHCWGVSQSSWCVSAIEAFEAAGRAGTLVDDVESAYRKLAARNAA